MCGITGFLGFENNSTSSDLINILNKMTNSLIHRGPDDSGVWYNFDDKIFIGHRRLSVIDLKDTGSQPMTSFSQRYIISYNGEIYNYKYLKKYLENKFNVSNWKGTSDTEILLNCIDYLGIDKALELVDGMFAFALWDKKEKNLILARDRIGEKPIYYGWQENKTFLFTSEIKSMYFHPSFKKIIDKKSLSMFLNFNNVPAPHSIYQDIFKLKPGCYAKVNLKNKDVKIIKYWEPKIEKNTFDLNMKENYFVDNLTEILKKSISNQMISDVPIGAFLSGGIDSSLVSSIMQSISNKKIDTFTVGFEKKSFNEAPYAKKIANHIGTNHNEIYINEYDTKNIIPNLCNIYNEPFADSSQIPTFFISKFSKQKITVALSGDGGDELFGGYNRHFFVKKYWNYINSLPLFIRNILRVPLNLLNENQINFFTKYLFNKPNYNLPLKIKKISLALMSRNIEELFLKLNNNWEKNNSLVNSEEYQINLFEELYKKNEKLSDFQKITFLDLLFYLPNDILTKVDRASMNVSLETRLPFLSKDVLNFGLNLDENLKIKNNQSKWILRKVLSQFVPNEYFNRPKSGFAIPISEWLNTSLCDWSENLIFSNYVNELNLNKELIYKTWSDHKNKGNNGPKLWPILIFLSWYENQK